MNEDNNIEPSKFNETKMLMQIAELELKKNEKISVSSEKIDELSKNILARLKIVNDSNLMETEKKAILTKLPDIGKEDLNMNKRTSLLNEKKKSKKLLYLFGGSVAAAALTFLIIVPKFISTQKVDIMAKFTLLKGNVEKNSTKAKLGEKVLQTDNVTTDKNSIAVMQLNTLSKIVIRPETEFQLLNIIKPNKTKSDFPMLKVFQKKGSAFHVVLPNMVKYEVRTKTIVLGVRGTKFLVSENENNTKVMVLEGKVVVNAANNLKKSWPSEIIINAGEKLTVKVLANTEITTELGKLNKQDINDLKVLSLVKYVVKEQFEKLEKKSNLNETILPDEAIKKIVEQVNRSNQDGNSAQKSSIKNSGRKKLTLADIKKKYGKLSKIILKDGRVYIGAFRPQAGKMLIVTPNRSILVPMSNLKEVKDHN